MSVVKRFLASDSRRRAAYVPGDAVAMVLISLMEVVVRWQLRIAGGIRRSPLRLLAPPVRDVFEAGRAWCLSRKKRAFDVVGSAAMLLAAGPMLLLIALAIKLTSRGRVLFSQPRVGLDGKTFRLLKFRTMRPNDGRGPLITRKGDRRITPIGRFLRSTKLDELPQLVNVLLGEMSIVGPRPQTGRYVACYSAYDLHTLSVKPGLTDPATILLRDQEAILGSVSGRLMEKYYTSKILPKRLAINLDYIERAGYWYDAKIILLTGLVVLWPKSRRFAARQLKARGSFTTTPQTSLAGVRPIHPMA